MKYTFTNKSFKQIKLVIVLLISFLSISTSFAQTLNIEKVTVSGCFYTGGTSKCVVTVQVGWTGLSAGNNISVLLGADTITIAAESTPAYTQLKSPQVVAFEIPSDGTAGSVSATVLSLNATGTYTARTPCAPLQCNGSDLGGQVFFDYNNDGIHQSSETTGEPGVTVNVTDKDGILYSTTTDANGMWKVAVPAASYCVRVEYSNIPSDVRSTTTIAGNTTTQFYTTATCTADMGVLNLTDYSQNNPDVYIPIWYNGDPSDASLSTRFGISKFSYTDVSGNANLPGGINGDISPAVAPYSQIGPTWGLAWNKQSKKLYAGATLRRHCGLGPQGLAGLYTYDPTTNTVSGIDLTTLGLNFGTIGSNASRGTGSVPNPSWDIEAFGKIGKVGIGGVSIKDDGTELYVVNLFEKKIHVLNVPALTLNRTLNIPDPGCNGGTFRPWSVKFYKGSLYVGVVCDGETSQNKSDMTATIFEINPTTGAYSVALDFPLTYPKGYPITGSNTGWFPWTDNYNIQLATNGGGTYIQYSTPILADLDFDIDGAMVIDFVDRFASQWGWSNYAPDPSFSNTNVYVSFSGGDVLRAFKSNGVFALENAGKSGPLTGAFSNNNEGPGFGEFFNDNLYGQSGGGHTEMTSGGIAIKPGAGEVFAGMMDPGDRVCSGGVKVMSTQNGAYTRAINTYGNGCATLVTETFGKSNGLGDVEFALDLPNYSQIGNRVWYDTDADGIQDPCESGIAGIVMTLYDASGILVGTTTTNATGNYYFGNNVNSINLTPGADYYVTAGDGQYTAANGLVDGSGNKYGELTLLLTGEGTVPTNNDNNASIAPSAGVTSAFGGLPHAKVIAPATNTVDHSIDFGFTNGSIGNYVWADDNNDGLQNELASNGINGVTVNLLKDDGTGNFVQIATTSTANDGSGNPGYYNFPNLITGNYQVQFPTSAGNYPISGTTIQTLQIDGNNDANATTGLSAVIAINPLLGGLNKNDNTIDAGYRTNIGSIGNYVWYDGNNDGSQNEPTSNGINGITVNLLKNDGLGNYVQFATTTTANDGSSNPGYYNFPNLNSGDYKVEFPISANGSPLTSSNQSAQSDGNSDAGIIDGLSASIIINTASGTALDVNNPTIDAGYIPRGSLGNYVWYDLNNDGIQNEAAANGINGVTVNLLKDDGAGNYNQVATTTTADDGSGNPGYYNFNNLLIGNYKVEFPTLVGSFPLGDITTTTAQTDGNNDANPITGLSDVIAIAPLLGGLDKDNPTIDAGYRTNIGSLGNYVWYDDNNDGLQNESSSNGVNGITVNLLKEDGSGNFVQIATTTTANDGSSNPGYYSFNQLFSGNYKVEFPATVGANKISKVTNQASQIDGNNDANSSTGLSGVVAINTLLGGVDKDNSTIDAGYYRPAQLGNYVWNDINKDGIQDANEVGVAGISVTLYDNANTIIASTATDAYGYYLFNPLAPGNYHVGFTLPSNYVFTGQDATSDVADSDVDPNTGLTGNYILVNGDSNMTVDAGIYFEQPTTASVGNFVWFDTNHDGIQDSGEQGISGVTVTLCTPAGVVVATTKTDANGFYLFSDVTPGTYAVGFTAPVGLLFSPNNGGVNDPSNSDANPTTGKTSTFPVVAGDKITYVDAGLYNQSPTVGGLGDKVWYDVNQNGIQDAGENGVAGVTVTLYQADGSTPITSMITDAYGNYIFNNLPQGQYVVGFSNLPTNYILTNTDGTDSTTNSDANQGTGKTTVINLAAGQFNMTYDAGIYTTISTNNNSIGNYVWNDANKDGIQDAIETGVVGVTATLYDNTNTIISVTATNENGYYLFPDLPNGVYHVGFSNIPLGYGFSTTGQGTLATDSDPNQSTGLTGDVALTGNTHDMTLDAGIAKGNTPRLGKGTLGDLVWYDMNNDGLQSAGESGVTGVIVTLYQADGTTVIKTTTTDALGNYIFTNLDAGNYIVGFTNLPAGFTISPKNTDGQGLNGELNSDVNIATQKTDIISLGTGEDKMSVDMGINPPAGTASLGDKVWIDLNNDGLQTLGEPGVPGISVALYDNTNTIIATTTTDANGEYHFVGLTPGDYSVGFSNLPNGYTFTSENIDAAGINGSANSDANPTTGLTSSVTLASGDNNLNLDAGIKTTTVASVGDYVWLDINRDGIQDPSESGIGGILVTLYDNNNNPVASTITRPDGSYLFTNVTPGTYTIGFTNIPTGLDFTIQETDPNSNIGSNVNPTSGLTPSFTVLPGTHNPTIDAGLTTPLLCGLGDFVWIDVDQNGQQNAGEPVVAGALVTLYAANGTTVLATASTDGNGAYSFVNLPAGTYVVGFGNVPSITKADGNVLVAVPTSQNIGNDAGDNDMGTNGRTGTYTLVAGEYNPTVDAGFKYQFALGVKQLEATSVVFTNEFNCNVNWFTVDESNTSNFDIERSIDNINFESVGTKACLNNTIVRTNYTFQDNIEAVKTSSTIYYRIRLNDIDGKKTLSNVIVLKNKLTSNEVSVYPIPFKDVITIDYPSNGTSTVSISFYDLSGRVLRETEKEVTLGLNTFTINDVNTISSGTYYVKIIDQLTGEVYIKKLVK